eukprot:jgi/Botrbrau1/8882/Bobra.0148s0002.1
MWERGIEVGSMWDWWDCDYKIPTERGIDVGLWWDQCGIAVGSIWDRGINVGLFRSPSEVCKMQLRGTPRRTHNGRLTYNKGLRCHSSGLAIFVILRLLGTGIRAFRAQIGLYVTIVMQSNKSYDGNGRKQRGGEGESEFAGRRSTKEALDDAAAQVIIAEDYPEDKKVANLKLGLGLATCFFALLAQFYPKKFPDNWWLLLEGDAFLITQPKNGVPVRVASRLPRYTTAYTLVISKDTGRHQPKTSRESVTLPTQVTSYFDEEGYLAQHIFQKDVKDLLHKFEAEIQKPRLDNKKSL